MVIYDLILPFVTKITCMYNRGKYPDGLIRSMQGACDEQMRGVVVPEPVSSHKIIADVAFALGETVKTVLARSNALATVVYYNPHACIIPADRWHADIAEAETASRKADKSCTYGQDTLTIQSGAIEETAKVLWAKGGFYQVNITVIQSIQLSDGNTHRRSTPWLVKVSPPIRDTSSQFRVSVWHPLSLDEKNLPRVSPAPRRSSQVSVSNCGSHTLVRPLFDGPYPGYSEAPELPDSDD